MSKYSKQIANLLQQQGIKPNLLGFYYIKDAVEKCIEDPTYVKSITKRLYGEIAKEHKTTATRVERAIRCAISTRWPLMSDDFKMTYCNSLSTVEPSNGEFIATLAYNIKEICYE